MFVLCTQMCSFHTICTPFKTIWPNFCHCVPNWLLSRPYDLIFVIVYTNYSFQDSAPLHQQDRVDPSRVLVWPDVCIVYPNHYISKPYDLLSSLWTNCLFSRPFYLILSLCTQLTTFKTIWPNFVIVYTIDSFQDHLTWCLYCVPKLLISNHMSPFKTIWPDFCIVYPIDSFQYHLISFLHCVHKLLLSRPYDQILSLFTQLTPFKTIWPNFVIM